MAEKFACMQCGFVFDDPDMEMCPQCGTELGKEWNPEDLVDVLVTDLAGAKVPDLIRVVAEISGYPTQKIGPMLQKLPAVVYSGATPMQADLYLEKIRATNAAAMAESAHDKSSRLAAEANAAGAAATAATEQARLSAAERQAKLDAEMKLKAEQAEAAARVHAESEAKTAEEKAKLEAEAKAKIVADAKAKAEADAKAAEEKAKAEADARAKAEAEAEKAKAEAEAKKAEAAKLQAEAEAKAAAEAKLKAEAEAKAAEEKAKAEADARAKAEAEAEKAKAEAEAKKAEADAKFAAEKAKAEAEALAQAEIEKKRLEIAAEEKAKQDVINAKKRKKRKIWTIIWTIIILIIGAFAGLVYLGYSLEEQEKAEAARKQAAIEAEAARKQAAIEAEAARKQAAIEQEKRDAERRAREEAERKAALERQRMESARIDALGKQAIDAVKKSPAIVVDLTKVHYYDYDNYTKGAVQTVEKFYLSRGKKIVFKRSLRAAAALKHGILAGYDFPVKVEIKEATTGMSYDPATRESEYYAIVTCIERLSDGEVRQVHFKTEKSSTPLIYQIWTGEKYDGERSYFSFSSAEWK